MWILEEGVSYEGAWTIAVSADPEKLKAFAVKKIHPKSEKLRAKAMKRWVLENDCWVLSHSCEPYYEISQVEVL